MNRTFAVIVLAAAVALGGCSHKKAEGFAPAQDWNADRAEVIPPGVGPAPSGSPHSPHVAIGAGDPDDPHAGITMGGANPHEGVDMGGASPHQGVDMGGANPHEGVDMTGAMAKMAPDPDRAIDPTHHIRGVIKIDPKAKDRVKSGTALFVFAELPDANGNPVGPPLAVQKLSWQKDGMAFELSEANAMVAGTELSGEVIVVAHYDQDGDAKTKQPGDVLGTLRVKIPAETATLLLDNVIP